MANDLRGMSKKQLEKLQKDVEKALRNIGKKEMKEAKKAAEKAAALAALQAAVASNASRSRRKPAAPQWLRPEHSKWPKDDADDEPNDAGEDSNGADHVNGGSKDDEAVDMTEEGKEAVENAA